MRIHLPSRLGNTYIALVLQLNVHLLIVGVLIRNHRLLIVPSNHVPIRKMPHSVPVRLVVSESALIKGAVCKLPSSLYYLILSPLAHQLGSCIIIGVSSFSVFLSEHPPSRIRIFIRINICSLPMLDPVLPLP